MRDVVQRGPHEAVLPVPFPELFVLEAVDVDGLGVNPTRPRRFVTLALLGLADINDRPNPRLIDLLPARGRDLVDVFGTEEDASRRGRAIDPPQAAQVTGIHQAVNAQRAVG